MSHVDFADGGKMVPWPGGDGQEDAMTTFRANLGYRIEEGFPLAQKGDMRQAYTFQILRTEPGQDPVVHMDGKTRGLWFKSRWAAVGCAEDMLKWAIDQLRQRGIIVKQVGT